MRQFFTLGAVALMAIGCGASSSIGDGLGGVRGKDGGAVSETGGKPAVGGGAMGAGGATTGGGGAASGAGGTTAGQCTAASDCPQPAAACQACADGTTACPSVDCIGGKCVGSFPTCGGAQCKSAAECAVPAICKLCSDGSSSCATGGCVNGQCVTTFPPCPGGNVCKVKSDCPQPATPCQACADGTSACPSVDCMGGKCVSSLPSCSGAQCKSAAECAVPAICKLCSDGSSTCATGGCVNGQCVTTFPPCAGGNACKMDSDCPAPPVACHPCPDGLCAPVSTTCTSGQCSTTIGVCGGTPLKWFSTCGPVVCQANPPPSGLPPCTTAEKAGASCKTQGTQCDTGQSCAGPLECAASDPKSNHGCPISRAKYKQDIQYVSQEERAKLASDVQSIPLVRYRYKDGPEREHLGFIIEDIEPSPSVDSKQDQVDLYGYTSMAVAALQQQHAEIEALKREVQSLKTMVGRHARESK